MHCHFDSHLLLGLATAFEVDNGPTPESTLPPPPPDYPTCQKKLRSVADNWELNKIE